MNLNAQYILRNGIACFVCLTAFAIAFVTVGCEREKAVEFEPNAVFVDFRITPEQAATGVQKDVRAPNGTVLTLIVPKGVKHLTPLKLPPRAAKNYEYPLYFRVHVLRKDEKMPDDPLNRKK